MPLDHFNILHESNLPRIAEILLKWCDVLPHESRVYAKAGGE